jgi:general stress protein CsbA
MNKIMILVMVIAIIVAFYEQSKDTENVYITAIAIIVFMIGMIRLSAKTPSKNQKNEEDNV